MSSFDESEIQWCYETYPGWTTGMTTVVFPSDVVTVFFNANVLPNWLLVRSIGGISLSSLVYNTRMTEAHKGQM